MENIAVIFGGKSVEHDISIISALQVMKNLSKKYNLIPVYIRSDGVMVSGDNLQQPRTYLDYAKNVKKEVEVGFACGKKQLYFYSKNKIRRKEEIAAAILCTHGQNGEDGTLQGLLELCGLPYTSPSVAASAICMDKTLTKIVLLQNEIETPSYVQISRCEYEAGKEKLLRMIEKLKSFPCIIKPARCGSSVGISICENKEKLEEKIENAFLYDDKVLVEDYVENAKEYFCAAIKVGDEIVAGKIDMAQKEKFYTFEEKYINHKDSKRLKITKALQERVRALVRKTYEAVECDGVVRVDFLYDEAADKLYVNEVNTIPGSLAFNLFDYRFEDLLNVMIKTAKERSERKKEIVYQFSSTAIENYINLSAGEKYQK